MADLVVRYQDDDLLVVEKPAGMHTAPLREGETGTLLALVVAAFPEVGGLPGLKAVEPGLLHRLDRDTSGLVVAARTAAAFAALGESFRAGRARKVYAAVCAAGPDAPARVSVESRFAPQGPGGRRVRVLPAETPPRLLGRATRVLYRTEAAAGARGAGTRGGLVAVEAVIARGFRHQVRAHLAFAGLPIVGDPLYGVPVPAGAEPRLYLHAARIEMPHPRTGEPLDVRAPAPASFAALLEEAPGGLS